MGHLWDIKLWYINIYKPSGDSWYININEPKGDGDLPTKIFFFDLISGKLKVCVKLQQPHSESKTKNVFETSFKYYQNKIYQYI